MINGITTRVKAGPDQIRVPRYVKHSIKCIAEVRSVVKEQTDPTGEFKEWYVDELCPKLGLLLRKLTDDEVGNRFFRDFFAFGNPTSFLHVMRAFWDGDVYPALPGGFHIMDQLVSQLTSQTVYRMEMCS